MEEGIKKIITMVKKENVELTETFTQHLNFNNIFSLSKHQGDKLVWEIIVSFDTELEKFSIVCEEIIEFGLINRVIVNPDSLSSMIRCLLQENEIKETSNE